LGKRLDFLVGLLMEELSKLAESPDDLFEYVKLEMNLEKTTFMSWLELKLTASSEKVS
jgi:hypothetical protein